MRSSPFIKPCLPSTRTTFPTGDGWLHEVKFDGWRLQLHKQAKNVRLYSKRGSDFTKRFPEIADALRALPVGNAILDSEIVACNQDRIPLFELMHQTGSDAHRFVWIFDVLALEGEDLRPRPLIERKNRLEQLFAGLSSPHLGYSESFSDPIALLKAADRLGLEGIVSKRRNAPYRSGPSRDWIKTKTAAWRQTNRERWRLFEPKLPR
jgi:bifunctional non-homologous end joining protein LigD